MACGTLLARGRPAPGPKLVPGAGQNPQVPVGTGVTVPTAVTTLDEGSRSWIAAGLPLNIPPLKLIVPS